MLTSDTDAYPALIAVGLLILETIIIAAVVPETKHFAQNTAQESGGSKSKKPAAHKLSIADRKKRLKWLEALHFSFVSVFSGL